MDRLVAAISQIVRCRPVLRNRFVVGSDNSIRQYPDETMEVPVCRHQMSEEEAIDYIHHGFVRPFQLFGAEPLCRFETIETPLHHWLLMDFHHSIADGMTIVQGLMGHDLPVAYEGGELAVDNLLYTQAEQEDKMLLSQQYLSSKAFFTQLFSDVDFTSPSMLLTSHSADESGDGLVRQHIPREEIDRWCEYHEVNVNLLFMAAFCVVASKLFRADKVAFATLSHGRGGKALRLAYGMFVKTIPFVSEIDADAVVLDYIRNLRRQLMAVVRHTAYPYTHFCRDLQKTAQLTFAFQGEQIMERVCLDSEYVDGKQLRRELIGDDVGCVVYAQANDYEIRMDASPAQHDMEMLNLFVLCMVQCVNEMMHCPHAAIGQIQLATPSETKLVLNLSKGETTQYDPETTFPVLLTAQVERSPHSLAVTDGNTSLTYSELDMATRQLACWIHAQGMGSGDFVGVRAIPSCGFLVAAVAIMRAGAAYVPIDPAWPDDFQQSITKEAELRLILDPDRLPDCGEYAGMSLSVSVSPDDMAYMMFTSGTTGASKGVMIPHRALTNLLHFLVRRWPLDASCRISCHSSLAFDASVEDLFPVLTVGGSVHIMPEEVRHSLDKIHQFISSHAITGGCYTTQLGVMVARRAHPTLRYICLGGERLTSVPEASCRVYNTYGPTEFCVDATYCELQSGKSYPSIPIGRPLDNTIALVLDSHGRLLPQGAIGELCLAGWQMALGYFHDDQLTDLHFTTCDVIDQRIYHTGDLARWNDEGELEYVGRLDRLVKVNGYRVSLEEVERLLASLPHVTSVHVKLLSGRRSHQMCAYYTANDLIESKTLLRMMRGKCPTYMVPSYAMQLDKMPMKYNGKIDANGLPAPQQDGNAPLEVPTTLLQRHLCEAFAKVLKVEQVGMEDDFFDLGGTSLAAMELMEEMAQRGFPMEYGWVFSHPTPDMLSQKMSDHLADVEFHIEGDYSDIHQLLARSATPAKSDSTEDFDGNLLLTGATGFLGAHILHELLLSCKGEVYCLARAASQEEARQRLLESYLYYFDRLPSELFLQRIHVVVGDLCHEDWLTCLYDRQISLVVNCAANVRHYARVDALEAVNTLAVESLMRFCQSVNARLVQVSTLGIAGMHHRGERAQLLTERDLYIGQHLTDPYSYTKFMAEKSLLRMVAKTGMKANIIRVGNLSPRSFDGKFQRNASENRLMNAMKLCALLGYVPRSADDIRVDFSPVDMVAKAVVRLIALTEPPIVSHIANPQSFSIREMLETQGNRVEVLDDSLFMEMVEKAKSDAQTAPLVLSAVTFMSAAKDYLPNPYLCQCSE